MDIIFNAIRSVWELLFYVITNVRPQDVLDIVVIAFLIYKCIEFLRQSRGGTLIKGLVVLLAVALIANWFDMVTVNWLMKRIMDSILVAAVIIFQPEIRRALEHVGTSRFSFFGKNNSADTEKERLEHCIDAACKAAGSMQEQKCGALMVFERTTQLGEIIATGTTVDAEASAAIIGNIFYPKSPLHDGGMILRDGKVYAAGCILPLTQNTELNKALGTRHRAAIGMSENSDAVVVVVSEETGTISLAVNGKLRRGFDAITLHTELTDLLIDSNKENGGLFARIFGSLGRKSTTAKDAENLAKTVEDNIEEK